MERSEMIVEAQPSTSSDPGSPGQAVAAPSVDSASSLTKYIALALSSASRLGFSDGPFTPELQEVLKKSGIVPEKWVVLLEGFERRFSRAVGGLESLGPILVRLGQQTVSGIQLIRDAFSQRVVQVVAARNTRTGPRAHRGVDCEGGTRPHSAIFVSHVFSADRGCAT